MNKNQIDYTWRKNKLNWKNCHLFPSSYRMILTGKSGSGKTFLLFKLLLDACNECGNNYLDYDNLYLFSTTIKLQQEYQILINGIKEGLSKEQIKKFFEE